jgi:transposase-like protein
MSKAKGRSIGTEKSNTDPVNGPTPQRWTAKRKAAIVLEIIKGKTTPAEVARQHGLTVAEVEGWTERFMHGAEEFLKALPKEVEEQHSAEKRNCSPKSANSPCRSKFQKKVQSQQLRDLHREND